MATCKIHEMHPEVTKCERETLSPEGLCILHTHILPRDEAIFELEIQKKIANEDFDFSCILFSKPFSFFKNQIINLDVNFTFATFAEGVDFAGTTFGKGVNFKGASFRKNADFSVVSFQEVDFYRATFQEANFSETIFQAANFCRTTFRGANFSAATFQEANFSAATFQDADFYGAAFQEADFSGTTFQDADFYEATFHKASFSQANFFKANFSEATFQEVSFFEATFENAFFSWTTFQYAHFNEAIITGRVALACMEPSKENQPWLASFRNIQLGEKGVLSIEDLSLARAVFTGTDLRRVEFDRVTWASWWWRTAVYDEILLHQWRWAHISYLLNYGWLWGKKVPDDKEGDSPIKLSYEDFAPVERLYRQLKVNYENERDFKRVGDFHYGEMEMHRRGSPWRQWVPFSWHNLYRVLSGYGERPLLAFIWLLLLIPIWAGLVWGLGINHAASSNPVSYLDTLLYIFEKVTFQRPPLPAGLTWLGKFLSGLSVLLISGQAALFILALRNRLGRRR